MAVALGKQVSAKYGNRTAVMPSCLTITGWGGRLEIEILKNNPAIFNCHMNVGVCKVHLRLPENTYLKGKRQVLKSITSRVRNKFNVAVAEVDDNDTWQLATIGICYVSNSGRHTNQVLSRVVNFIVGSRFEVEILDYEIEMISV